MRSVPESLSCHVSMGVKCRYCKGLGPTLHWARLTRPYKLAINEIDESACWYVHRTPRIRSLRRGAKVCGDRYVPITGDCDSRHVPGTEGRLAAPRNQFARDALPRSPKEHFKWKS